MGLRGSLQLAAILFLVGSACGGDDRASEAGTEPGDRLPARILSGYGLSIELPRGWDGWVSRRAGVDHEQTVLQAANFELSSGDDDVATVARKGMDGGGIVIGLVVSDGPDPTWWTTAELPIEIRRSDLAQYEGFAPHAAGIRHLLIDRRSVRAFAAFGTDPGDVRLAEANAVLSTLEIGPPPEPFERIVRRFSLPRGSGLHRFTFAAPNPSEHALDVYLSVSRDADLGLVFRTADGGVLRVLDSTGRECERDDRMGCEVHLPASEARRGGSWRGELRKRSASPANVSLRLVFVPLSP